MTPEALLAQLRDPSPGGALSELSALVVDQQLARPVRDAVDPRRAAELLGATLGSWCAAEGTEEQMVRAWRAELDRFGRTTGRLGDKVPERVRAEIQKLAEEPYSLDRDLLLALLDRGPFRALIRELLVETLQNFAQRLGNPVAETRVAKTVRGLGKRARNRARSHAGGLGSLAGAVTGGVERQLERRVTEFADSALSNLLQRIADYLCSPDRAEDQAALRLGFLDGLWDLRAPQLATEVGRANLEATAAMVRGSLEAWVEQPDFDEQCSGWIARRLDAMEDRSVADLLSELGILDSIRDYALERSLTGLGDLVASEAFETWLTSLENAPQLSDRKS